MYLSTKAIYNTAANCMLHSS
jgi:tRNA 2-thiouridine synthesizing protein A